MSVATTIVRIRNKLVPANSYILGGVGGACTLVDPGSDLEAIAIALDERGLTPTGIYCTHGHFDHLGSAADFQRQYSIPVYLHAADLKLARSSNFRMLALKLPTRITLPDEFNLIEEGSARGDGVEIVAVPGHTPGSVMLLHDGHAFTGDTLYRDETWPVHWPETDEISLVRSVRRLWELIPDETVVYPGHGGSATFGSIKRRNRPLRQMLGLEGVGAS